MQNKYSQNKKIETKKTLFIKVKYKKQRNLYKKTNKIIILIILKIKKYIKK